MNKNRLAKIFGVVLREQRKKKELSQAKLAESSGLTIKGIRQLELGYRRPKLQTFIKLSEGLDITYTAFMAAFEEKYKGADTDHTTT